MKKDRSTNTINALFFVFAVMAFAPGMRCYGQENATAPAPEKTPRKTMSGTVNEVRAVFKTLRLTGEMGLVTIVVPDKTPITKNNKKIHLDDIDTGDSLLITYYSPAPGKYIAISILDGTSEGG